MDNLNIVELIETNPITKLTDTYNVKLLNKIKSNFTDFEQQLFITSFYCYLNYNKTKDFVIDLDNIWNWLGFSSKQNAIKLLEKHFKVEEDYNNFVLNLEDKHQKSNDGGHNIKKFMLNIKCFKSLCLKTQTKKASQIHEYYMKMEEIVQEVIDEESAELRLQLENKNKQLKEQEKQIEIHKNELKNINKDKCLLKETTLLSQFPDNVQCIYIGMIDDVVSSKKDEPLVKFGCSNFFSDRVKHHKTTYTNFRLCAAYRVCNKTQVENAIKIHPVLVKQLRKLKIKKVEHKEILSIKTITIEKIDEIIRDIIKNIEYTPENYTKMLEENDKLNREIDLLKIYTPENYTKIIIENDKIKREYQILQEKSEDENKMKQEVFKQLVKDKNILYNKIIDTKPFFNEEHKNNSYSIKQKDGLYYLPEGVFSQLDGTRQEVWVGIAYKTSGGLKKQDLIIGVKGNVISKLKSVSATSENRLMTYMEKIGKVKPNNLSLI
jgi:hypothetical protein